MISAGNYIVFELFTNCLYSVIKIKIFQTLVSFTKFYLIHETARAEH